jgi:hypothetical protein
VRFDLSDVLIETWANIGKFLGLKKRAILYRREQLLRGRYVFYRKRRRGEKEVAAAWASKLKQYVEDRASQKKII